MTPAVTVLQLDTSFPRVPGDVACPDTFVDAVEIIRIPGASVRQVVSAHPEQISIAPFEDAVRRARGDVVVTSCGFLASWQGHLERLTDRPFISSSLTALSHLGMDHAPGEVLIVTFDAARLTAMHLGANAAHAAGIVGLPAGMHLREVIKNDRATLDTEKTAHELGQFIRDTVNERHRHILLECTNLPPYKRAIRKATGLPITDILTQIEAVRPGTVCTDFLEPEHIA